MELQLNSNQRIRISTDQNNKFIDTECLTWEQGIAIEMYPNKDYDGYQYLELRENENGFLKLFLLNKKSTKKDIDLDTWKDAKVVWSKNLNSNSEVR